MRIKLVVSMLTIACLLVVAISPLVARNSPFPEKIKTDTAAHPWQDDNQVGETVPIGKIGIPMGPIIITISIPQSWISQSLTKTPTTTAASTTKVKSTRPMSLDQKGESR